MLCVIKDMPTIDRKIEEKGREKTYRSRKVCRTMKMIVQNCGNTQID